MLLSLIGVAVAVAALTGIVALGAIAQQSQIETLERQSGRPALLNVSTYNPVTGETPDIDGARHGVPDHDGPLQDHVSLAETPTRA